MTKQEFLEVLIPELKRLEEVEHLRDLTRNGRYDEAQAVIAKVDYSLLHRYCRCYLNDDDCCLEVSDIPEKYLVTFTLYLSGNQKYDEMVIMRDWRELQEAVAKQGEDGVIIAQKMEDSCLTWPWTIAELMSPEEYEEDAEY